MPQSATGNDCDLAIVGAGVVGMALAHGAAGAGARVTILDEGDRAFRASRGNFALVWVQGKGVGLPPYARWTLGSSDLWPGFAAELEAETGRRLHYDRPGGVDVALDEAELEERFSGVERLHNAEPRAAAVEKLDRRRLQKLLPQIGPDVVGGTWCAADAHVNSLRLFDALHEAARLRGAAYRPNARVESIEPLADGFRLVTQAGEMRARRVALAAGLDNARLAPMLGLSAPVKPERGQVMVTEKVQPFLRHPMSGFRQTDEGGVMIGYSNEDRGYDSGQDWRTMARIAANAVRVFPQLAQARIVRAWAALRVMSPDGYPIYERAGSGPPAYVVTCHSGVTLAAAHARILGTAIARDAWPTEDLAPFSARRFAHG
ncbi:MAG: FAD-binding oxidoreductase [Rhizobiales bacterium]|nr:FAD-binding oxidoreductase [Hyphomicrobiales bacterium]